ncbi:protein kinase [Streptomyces sp. NPDC058872]|uniref:protein kinase domain-containing protein n=1 Tax=Streptomyces sp. NPDC058872 TaxID=3346661 RepID=UPI0036BCE211
MSGTAHHIGPDSAPDRYRLLRSIGRGGEAVLYLAEIELAGGTEPVVVKVLDSKTTITPELFERISRKWNEQAELLRFVHRPGVVGVREHFQGPPIHRPGESGALSGRALVLVMNHVDGLDLRDWRAERTLATPAERREVMRTLEQLADVLDWLHSGRATPSGRVVVHGDLSPGNVMVDQHGQATLVDFGLSKLTADHQTAEVWFTPGYAAPEVFEGKRTPGSDRYAFGAIAHFLLSGESPPPVPEQLSAALAALPPVAALPPEQRARVLSIAAADPDERPVSLSGWVKDVRHGVVSTTTTNRPATLQDAVPPPVPPLAAPAPPTAPPVRDAVPPVPPPGTPPLAPPPLAPDGTGAPGAAGAPGAPGAPQGFGPPTYPVTTGPAAAPGPLAAPGPAAARPERPEQPAGATHAAHQGISGPGGPSSGAPVTAPPPAPRRKRRTGPVLGAVAAVAVIALAAAVGVKLLGDRAGQDADSAKGGGATASAPAATAPAATGPAVDTEPTAESPSPDPTALEPEPVDADPTDADPTGTESADPSGSVGPSYASDARVADLTALTPISEHNFKITSTKIDTKEYGAALHGSCYYGAYVEYDLNRAWETFEFTAGVDDGSKVEAARVVISVDDQPALFNENVHLGKPVSRTLNVTGALRLRLKVESSSCSQHGNGVIAAPTLRR